MIGVAERMNEHLSVASQSVRAANHLTLGGAFALTWHYPTLGAVTELIGRLPQLIEHMQTCARRAADEPGSYRTDDDSAPATRLAEVTEDLRHAVELLGRLDRVLNDAWSGLGTLAYLDPSADDADDEHDDDADGEPRVPRRRRPRGPDGPGGAGGSGGAGGGRDGA